MYELKEGDLVLTINPVTKALEEQPIKRVIIQDYEGEMIEFKNSFINLLVTPNHRIYTEDMRVIEAKDCLKEKVIRFPRMNPKSGKEEQILIGKEKKPPEEIFYLIGVFLGDGFLAYQKKVVKSKSGLSKKERDRIAKDKKTGRFIATGKIGNRENVEMNSWRIYFDIPENDRCRKKVEETLEKLSIKFHKQKGKAGEHLYFTSKEWFKFFEQFKKGARNKFIPDWIFDYDGKYLKKLFEGLIDSDGRWENLSFSTVSKALAEGISQLAIRIGYYPNIQRKYSESIFERRVIKGWSYYLNFNNGRKAISNKFISKKFYKGKIWCIEVKNKNFLVERDGKFAFCGNTDEVFGPAPEGVYFKEEDRFKPSNPYSASKAGEEMIAYSFAHAFGLPTSIVRSMNIIGERQHPEKFLPKTIKAILNNAKIALHGKGREDLSSRCWIHARNVADGLLFLLDRAEPKEFYHIVGEERTVLEMADWVCEVIKGRKLKDDEIQWIDYFTARPGHDKRYALSGEKLAKMGWRPPKNLEESLKKTVKWTLGHQKWLNL